MRHFPELAGQYSADYVDLAEVIPATTPAVSELLMDGLADGALVREFEELIAFAVAVTARYDDHLVHRSQVVIKPGVSRPEAIEMIGVEFLMEGGPSMLRTTETSRSDENFARLKQWNLTARVLMCFEIKPPIEF